MNRRRMTKKDRIRQLRIRLAILLALVAALVITLVILITSVMGQNCNSSNMETAAVAVSSESAETAAQSADAAIKKRYHPKTPVACVVCHI